MVHRLFSAGPPAVSGSGTLVEKKGNKRGYYEVGYAKLFVGDFHVTSREISRKDDSISVFHGELNILNNHVNNLLYRFPG